MEIPPSGALIINGSLYLTIDYLLKGGHEDLESKVDGWMAIVEG